VDSTPTRTLSSAIASTSTRCIRRGPLSTLSPSRVPLRSDRVRTLQRSMFMSDIPNGLRYTAEHEWVQDKGAGVVRVGITAYAAEALGDVVYVSLPAQGDTVTGGESCGEIESTK